MSTIGINRTDAPVVGHVSWAAVIAGVVSALGVASLLNLLGLGLGLATFTLDADVLKNLGLGSVIWLALNSIISMFIGGWVAGKLAGNLEHRIENLIHGFLAWSIAMMLSFFVATTAAGYVVSGFVGLTEKAFSSVSKGISSVTNTVAPQVGDAISGIVPDQSKLLDQVKAQADDLFKKAKSNVQQKVSDVASGNNVDELKSVAQQTLTGLDDKFAQAIQKLFNAVGSKDQDKAKQVVINLLVDQANISEKNADAMVTTWIDAYQDLAEKAQEKANQAKEYAVNVTEKTTNTLSTLALITLLTLLLGAVSACIGAVMGASSPRAYDPNR